MLTDPTQEDVFHEEEFVKIHYRDELLPFWVKLLAAAGAVSGFLFGTSLVITTFISEEEKNLNGTEMFFLVIVVSLFTGVFFTCGIACINLLQEKKWAIYGVIISVLLHLALFSASLSLLGGMKDESAIQLAIPVIVILALLLVFLVKLILIFKRWLEYQPSGMRKR